MTGVDEPNWEAGAHGEKPEQMWSTLDATGPGLLRLVISLAAALDIYPAAADYDTGRTLYYDLPGGVGLVSLDTLLDDDDLATLGEVLDVAVDEQRGPDCDDADGGAR